MATRSTAATARFTIRRMVPQDAPSAARLVAWAFAEEFAGTGITAAVLARGMDREAHARRGPFGPAARALSGDTVALVATHHNELAGYVALAGNGVAVVSSLAVHPGFRRRGIATALLEHAERLAAEAGYDRVTLDVLAHNTGAAALYAARGYAPFHSYRALHAVTMAEHPAPSLPEGYRWGRLSARAMAGFDAVEAAALPNPVLETLPSQRQRYEQRPPGLVERLLSGMRVTRRVLVRDGAPAGFLIAWSTTGQQRGRIGYPLLTPEHTAALPAALDDLRRFLATAGATWARLDLSETRPDQHAAAVAAGWVQHWTYVQMAKRLTRGHRIPVRRRVEPRPEAVDFPAHPGDPPVLV